MIDFVKDMFVSEAQMTLRAACLCIFFLGQPLKFSNNLLFFSKETFTVSYEVTLVKPLLDPTFNLSKLSDDISNIFSTAKYLVNDFSSYFIDVQFFFKLFNSTNRNR